MHQKLIYRALLFSLSVAFCSQASEGQDELGIYSISERIYPGGNYITKIAKYENNDIEMKYKHLPGGLITREIYAGDECIAEYKIFPGGLEEKDGPVINWETFPYQLSPSYTQKKGWRIQQNASRVPIINNQQSQVTQQIRVSNKRSKATTLQSGDANTIKQKNDLIQSRFDKNFHFFTEGRVGSFKTYLKDNQDKVNVKPTKDQIFLFLTINNNQKDQKSINNLAHAIWCAYMIRTGFSDSACAAIIKKLSKKDNDLAQVTTFKSLVKDNLNVYEYISDLIKSKKEMANSPIAYHQIGEKNLLPVIANCIIHLKCDNNYSFLPDSELVELFFHRNKLLDKTTYSIVILIEDAKKNVIECLVNKVDNCIEIISRGMMSGKCKNLLKGIFNQKEKFLEKEIIKYYLNETGNVKCAESILQKLAIDKTLTTNVIDEIIENEIKQDIDCSIVEKNMGVPLNFQQISHQQELPGGLAQWMQKGLINFAIKYPGITTSVVLIGASLVGSIVKNGAGRLFALGIMGVLGLWAIMSRKKT